MPGWVFMEPQSGLFFVTVTATHVYWNESKYCGRRPTKKLPDSLAATYEARMDAMFLEFKKVLDRCYNESRMKMLADDHGACVALAGGEQVDYAQQQELWSPAGPALPPIVNEEEQHDGKVLIPGVVPRAAQEKFYDPLSALRLPPEEA
ncbi:unnamed protein product [Amoebophrya sp. A120]|nr:unnamed protein product [Amoebophrya sp. A120]|eukprot:GSA120T00004492001.1